MLTTAIPDQTTVYSYTVRRTVRSTIGYHSNS